MKATKPFEFDLPPSGRHMADHRNSAPSLRAPSHGHSHLSLGAHPASHQRNILGYSGAMGILADFFVADPLHASSYEHSRSSDLSMERFQVEEFSGVTSLELEILWAIVEGEEWSPKRHALEAVGQPAETWLFRFPTPFLTRLAGLEATELQPLASKWAKIEELSCNPEDLQPVLRSLVSLAKSARETGRALFVWGSL